MMMIKCFAVMLRDFLGPMTTTIHNLLLNNNQLAISNIQRLFSGVLGSLAVLI